MKYRILSNKKSVFALKSETEFTEVQKVGKNYSVLEYKVTTYHDKLLIAAIESCENGLYEEISEVEYLDFVAECQASGKRLT